MEKQTILLESGTNELEVVEFSIADNRLGINVAKIREIINAIPFTRIPKSHPYIEGLILIRNEVIPLISLAKVLGLSSEVSAEDTEYIITEFNKVKVAFRVDQVSMIHRFSWNDMEKPSAVLDNLEGVVIGVIKQNDSMILLLDYEKIIADIQPSTSLKKEDVKKLGKRERSDKKIIIAEDSPMLQRMLKETLYEAGYGNVTIFENGKEALEYLESLAMSGDKELVKDVQLVITDIEMPKLDGHHLTKRIKNDDRLKVLPVVLFSSLISDSLRHKGEQVGADAQVTKPEIAELVGHIDRLIL